MINEISSKDILRIINGNCVGTGVYGMVYEYDDTTLIKFYYKDFFKFFTSRNINDLDNEVDINLFVENEMFELRDDYVTKLDRLLSVVNSLTKAGCSLIKGIVMYRGYPVGILLNYYKDYSKLEEIFDKLDSQSKLVVIDKIKSILFHLFNCGIFPLDLKESNIMVNFKNLDVQFIDLDGDETRYEDDNYIAEFEHIKKNALKSFELMEKRLKVK